MMGRNLLSTEAYCSGQLAGICLDHSEPLQDLGAPSLTAWQPLKKPFMVDSASIVGLRVETSRYRLVGTRERR